MNDINKEEILLWVAECINEIYGNDIEEAKSIVTNSSFPELLDEMPDFVLHYNLEYWAEEIMGKRWDEGY